MKPWRDVISVNNWHSYVGQRAASSQGYNASVSLGTRFRANFTDRYKSPQMFLDYIEQKLQVYHAVDKTRWDNLDTRMDKLAQLSDLASDYLSTFKVDRATAAKRPDMDGRDNHNHWYSGNSRDNSVDRNVLSLARRAPRKAWYLKHLKAYYSNGGAGAFTRDRNMLLAIVGHGQYSAKGLIGLTPHVRLEQADFMHRGDYEEKGHFNCGGAFLEWSYSNSSIPFFLWLEAHDICVEDDKSNLNTYSVEYTRVDKGKGASEKAKLRQLRLSGTPRAIDMSNGRSLPFSTSDYSAVAAKDPRGTHSKNSNSVAAYVWTKQREIFIAQHMEQAFHHSSFVSGRAVRCAGMIILDAGKVRAVSNNSGHYKPDKHKLKELVTFLMSKNLLAHDSTICLECSNGKQWSGTPYYFNSKFASLEALAE